MKFLSNLIFAAALFALPFAASASTYGPIPSSFQNNGIQYGTANRNVCFVGDSITGQSLDVISQSATISGGTAPYTISSTWPTGLSPTFSTPTLTLAGLPSNTFAGIGTYVVPVSISDSASHTATINLTITVSQNYVVTFSGGGTSNGLTLTAPSSVVYGEGTYGPAWWAEFGTYGNVQAPVTGEFGLPGDTVEGLETRLAAPVSANCAAYVVMIGTNDIATDTSVQIETALSTIWNTLLSTGKPVIAETITPRTLTVQSQLDNLWAVDQWIRLQKGTKQGLYILDPAIYYGNPSSTQSAPVTGASYDQLHPNSYGAQLMFGPLVKLLNQLFPTDVGYNVAGASDLYDIANPFGNLVSNGMFYGTGGVLPTNGTGTIATSWSGVIKQGYGTTGTISAAFALSTLSDGTNAQQATISGSVATNYESSLLYQQTLVASNINAGDKLQASCRVELSAGSSNIGYPFINIIYTSNGVSYEITSNESTLGADSAYGLSYSGLIKTPLPALPTPSTVSSLYLQVGVNIYDVGSTTTPISGSFRIGACSVRKVQ